DLDVKRTGSFEPQHTRGIHSQSKTAAGDAAGAREFSEESRVWALILAGHDLGHTFVVDGQKPGDGVGDDQRLPGDAPQEPPLAPQYGEPLRAATIRLGSVLREPLDARSLRRLIRGNHSGSASFHV